MKNNEGFIVHPFETMDGKYHSGYGNLNKTTKSFSTLAAAKTYLARKGITKALYDNPSGTKVIPTSTVRRKIVRKKGVRRLTSSSIWKPTHKW